MSIALNDPESKSDASLLEYFELFIESVVEGLDVGLLVGDII
jgi:hypothetical protein